MKVTVCELSNTPAVLEEEWQALVAHARSEKSDLVLLPEMPFYPWIAQTRQVDAAIWQAAVEAHDRWVSRFADLAPAAVAGSRPVIRQGRRFNEGFVWSPDAGCRGKHTKYYLPDEPGFWEASWYERGEREFIPFQIGESTAGFLICSELWFGEHARAYARQGLHLLLCPRATPGGLSTDKWIAGGRTAAVMSGAFCLSSNRGHDTTGALPWGGSGWIIEPEEGRVLGMTSPEQPFLTIEIDLGVAENAKHTYPRYIPE
ncbi:MAG: carbon-nitrogen hydrolase family protein [Anaerolineae bacterium]|nr:carbon-nitrogen hydrolase family protein [Anaerolineae bacterium]